MTIEKVKIVKGANFISIEDTKYLSEEELTEFIIDLMEQPCVNAIRYLNILVNSQFSPEIEWLLQEYDFQFHDEIITVQKELNIDPAHSPYTFIDLYTISEKEFTKVWNQVMHASLNAPPSMNAEEQMKSIKIELGSEYRRSCIMVYEKGQPIGVTIPHIEEGTTQEGRIFYFGLIPEERGKGKSILIHQHTLNLLMRTFGATYYIGSTSHKNLPMLQVFKKNGCMELEKNKVYKRVN